jgi:hypothetical protein
VTPLLTALAIVVVAWFAAGSIYNVRRGREALRWMQGGLPALGARTTVRWLGTTAVQMVLREPRPPFQEVTLIVFLEPRDVPWTWALSRPRGRRDLLIVRAQLRAPPRVDLEVIDRRSWSGREVLRRLPAGEWSVREPASPGQGAAYHRAPGALARADELLALAAGLGVAVPRLSVRTGTPHLQLHLALPRPGVPADAFFRTLRGLGEKASH